MYSEINDERKQRWRDEWEPIVLDTSYRDVDAVVLINIDALIILPQIAINYVFSSNRLKVQGSTS